MRKTYDSAGSVNYTVCETISTIWFCILEKVEMNLDLNFEARYTGNYAFHVFQLNCILLLK